MKTMAFAASKGGVGKTTLTATFSVEARTIRVSSPSISPATWPGSRQRSSGSIQTGSISS